MTKKQIIAELRRHQKIIAKSRDALRDIMDEVDDQFENYHQAHDDLECCIETLSELV